MFWQKKFVDDYDTLGAEIKRLNKELCDCNDLLIQKENTIESLQKHISQLKHNEPIVEFDVENIGVYAIERTPDGCTTFGYKFVAGTKVEAHEWTMKCSIKQHNNFVKRLKQKNAVKI